MTARHPGEGRGPSEDRRRDPSRRDAGLRRQDAFHRFRGLFPMLFTFLLIIQSLVAAVMVALILMQRSEGGGLGVGGSPSGLMSARGAADFLTHATSILATLFVILSIALAG